MANTELCKYYMGLQTNFNKITNAVYTDIIKILDNHFNYNWTWEVADEKLVMDNSMICTTVTVYIPGRVLTGRSLCKIRDYNDNHLKAIFNAVSFIIDGNSNTQTPNTNNVNNNTSSQMTPEQIMSAINSPQQQSVNNTNNQMPNSTSLNNEVSYYELPPSAPNQTEETPEDYDVPQSIYNGFTKHQIDRLNQFKKDMGIINDEMFGKWVNTWDAKYEYKSDITPQNVESFLSFVENMGKSLC